MCSSGQGLRPHAVPTAGKGVGLMPFAQLGGLRLRGRPTGDWIGCQGSPAWFGAAGMATKLTWLVLGPDPSVCSCRAEQFTAH